MYLKVIQGGDREDRMNFFQFRWQKLEKSIFNNYFYDFSKSIRLWNKFREWYLKMNLAKMIQEMKSSNYFRISYSLQTFPVPHCVRATLKCRILAINSNILCILLLDTKIRKFMQWNWREEKGNKMNWFAKKLLLVSKKIK